MLLSSSRYTHVKVCLLWDELLCNFPVLSNHHCKICFLCPCSSSGPATETDDSVWLEIRVIYWAGQKVRAGTMLWESLDDLFGQPNIEVIIEKKKNFFLRYAEKTKPNTLESKPRQEYLCFLKRRFRNVPIVPADWIFSVVSMLMRNRMRLLWYWYIG